MNSKKNDPKKYWAITLAVILIFIIGSSILSMAASLIGTLNLFGSKYFFNGGNRLFGSEDYADYNESFLSVEKIKVDTDNANVSVIYGGSNDKVTIEAADKASNFSVTLVNGKLTIKEKQNKFLFNNGGNETIAIAITVPTDSVLDFDIDCGVGRFNSDLLVCNKFEIDSGVGDVYIGNLTAYSVDIDNGVGNLVIDTAVISKTDIDCGVGNVEINYNMSLSDCNIEANAGLSSLKINGETFSENVHSNPSAHNKIDIDSGLGNIDLTFLQ